MGLAYIYIDPLFNHMFGPWDWRRPQSQIPEEPSQMCAVGSVRVHTLLPHPPPTAGGFFTEWIPRCCWCATPVGPDVLKKPRSHRADAHASKLARGSVLHPNNPESSAGLSRHIPPKDEVRDIPSHLSCATLFISSPRRRTPVRTMGGSTWVSGAWL